MYWYNTYYKQLLVALTLLLLVLPACKTDSSADSNKAFFDIKGFFTADAARLKKQNLLVNKTVGYNGVSEIKKVHISDWNSELGMFIESDINKPAWKQSYKVTATDNFLIYKATDPALRTRSIIIKKEGGKVKWILISNHKKTMLYETFEKLSYFPDSVYVIEKLQRVRVIGTNRYLIKGEL